MVQKSGGMFSGCPEVHVLLLYACIRIPLRKKNGPAQQRQPICIITHERKLRASRVRPSPEHWLLPALRIPRERERGSETDTHTLTTNHAKLFEVEREREGKRRQKKPSEQRQPQPPPQQAAAATARFLADGRSREETADSTTAAVGGAELRCATRTR